MPLERTSACLMRALLVALAIGLILPIGAPGAPGQVAPTVTNWAQPALADRQPGYVQRCWYEIVRQKAGAIAEAGFDLIWLTPPSWAGEHSAGYNPNHYFKLSNSYGDALQQWALLVALLHAQILTHPGVATVYWKHYFDWGPDLQPRSAP